MLTYMHLGMLIYDKLAFKDFIVNYILISKSISCLDLVNLIPDKP